MHEFPTVWPADSPTLTETSMTTPIAFSINRMSVPRMPFAQFAALVQRLGVKAIEIRNDLQGCLLYTSPSPRD